MRRRGLRPTATESEPPDQAAALEIAARYLAPRPRSAWEVRRRLRKAGVDEATCAATLVELERFGFVDDLSFARWWLEQRDRHSPRGRRGIEAELHQHGVDRETIAALRLEDGMPRPAGNEDLPSTEEDRAAAALARHLGDRTVGGDRRDLQRLAAYLVRRGFGADVAWSAVRNAAGAADAEPDSEP